MFVGKSLSSEADSAKARAESAIKKSLQPLTQLRISREMAQSLLDDDSVMALVEDMKKTIEEVHKSLHVRLCYICFYLKRKVHKVLRISTSRMSKHTFAMCESGRHTCMWLRGNAMVGEWIAPTLLLIRLY